MDEYGLQVANMIVDDAASHDFLTLMDGYLQYNQIFDAKQDTNKTTFKCSWPFGIYEWIVMPFRP